MTLFKNVQRSGASDDCGLYCALAGDAASGAAMSDPCWDVMIGGGGPTLSTTFQNGNKITTYLNTSDEGFRRIVLCRDFHGRKTDYVEISEEFRLFHNLYFDSKEGNYVAFDDAGESVDVIRVQPKQVEVRMSYLRAFMAATQTNLLLYFEITRHFKTLQTFSTDHRSDDLCFKVYSDSTYAPGYTSFTRMMGKKLVRCEPMETCGMPPFSRPKKYQDFVIGGDVDAPILFNCNPDGLANYFGANSTAPHYLTPVFFKKEVMQKYYASSDYSISDGNLTRKGAWGLRLDNNAMDQVSAFLGDLGRDLPEREQIYWKSFNVAPEDRKISKTNIQRNFLGNFFDAENPEHRFKASFFRLQTTWTERMGWTLFLPLDGDDAHYFDSLRSMLAKNEQSEFDSLILALSKITIDSVDVKSLREYVGGKDSDDKSIALLEKMFTKLGLADGEEATKLLRSVQALRSSGVAHRKGAEFKKAITRFGFENQSYSAMFDEIMCRFIALFDALATLPPERHLAVPTNRSST